ncbi:Oxoglutarate/iron-dependent dioxygenase [Corchorus olitorius]|uniref:procollagen-proline 4-dioxygenase n=1 Tax=Corchorus olitorius TaxID=93759 RepID=A0A1R3GZ04_9ROSI|nr:Oxoglutarate/iron-dependent dioxygenase [Corchorus olitorius]
MKGKSKSSKRKLGLAKTVLLCSLSFLAGLFVSTFFSQDVPIIKPRLRRLEVVHEKVEEYHDPNPMPHGETGESSIESIPFQVLSWKPRAYYFPKFATAEQCEHIIKMAKVNLKPSTLALRKGETEESTKGTRTSSGTFISSSEDDTGILDFIEKKIAKATSIPQSHGEAFNVLRYEIGQKYDSHYDAFNPSEYGPQSSQRVASFLLYLSDVEEGGETMFPFENDSRVKGYDYRQCVGLKVKPRKGDGLLFYSLLLNGTIDRTSLHGSCPVIKGEKWVATKWIRDQEQND